MQRWEASKKRREQYLALKRLEKRRLIKLRKEGQRLYVSLTNVGRIEALLASMKECRELYPDGEYCMIIYDVPEDIRRIRGTIRRLVKTLAFRQLQRSVWVTRHKIHRSLSEYLLATKSDKYIKVFTVRNLDAESLFSDDPA